MFVPDTTLILQSAVLQPSPLQKFAWIPTVLLFTSLGFSVALPMGLLLYVRRRRALSRRQAMAAFAAEHGWQFHPRAQADLLRVTNGFRGGYARSMNPRIENVVSRTRHGVTVALFDFCFRVRDRLRRRLVACVWSETLHLPYFAVSRTRVVDRLLTRLGAQDINFDEHPAFSEHYRLEGDDEATVRKLFAPDVLDFFASRASLRQHDIMVEGENNCLMLHPRALNLPPAELTWLIEETEAVFRAFVCSQRLRSHAADGR